MQLRILLASPDALEHYRSARSLADTPTALRSIAAVLSPQILQEYPESRLIIRHGAAPMLGLLVNSSADTSARIDIQAALLVEGCRRLRLVDGSTARQLAQQLAAQLIAELGPALRHWTFAAIPRGGNHVLALLNESLDQQRPAAAAGTPLDQQQPGLILVDDCVLTGARLRDALAQRTESMVVVAHLASHPELRAAVVAAEPRVCACVAGLDLTDFAPAQLGERYQAWRADLMAHLKPARYWVGQTEHLCFPWTEPARGRWNPATGQVESAWAILPPTGSSAPDSASVPFMEVDDGAGPIRPAPGVLYADTGEEVLLTGCGQPGGLTLRDSARTMWNALLVHGCLHAIAEQVATQYAVTADAVYADVAGFISTLTSRGYVADSDCASHGR